MLIKVVDALGVAQTFISQAQEAVTDQSGSIVATGVAQDAMDANAFRSGFFVQNVGANPLYVNELGAATTGAGSYLLAPGAGFPPAGYPVSTGAVSILGTVGGVFTAREW